MNLDEIAHLLDEHLAGTGLAGPLVGLAPFQIDRTLPLAEQVSELAGYVKTLTDRLQLTAATERGWGAGGATFQTFLEALREEMPTPDVAGEGGGFFGAAAPEEDDAAGIMLPKDWLCYGKIVSIWRANSVAWAASYGYPHHVGVNPCGVVNDETGTGFQLTAGENVDTTRTLYLSLPPGTTRTLAVDDLVGYVPAWRPKIWGGHGGPSGHVVYGAPKDAGLPILDASQIDKAILFWHSADEPDAVYGYTTGWTIYGAFNGRFPVGVLAEDPDFGAINDDGGAKTHTHSSVNVQEGDGGLVGVSDDVAAGHLPPFHTTNFIRWNGLTV